MKGLTPIFTGYLSNVTAGFFLRVPSYTLYKVWISLICMHMVLLRYESCWNKHRNGLGIHNFCIFCFSFLSLPLQPPVSVICSQQSSSSQWGGHAAAWVLGQVQVSNLRVAEKRYGPGSVFHLQKYLTIHLWRKWDYDGDFDYWFGSINK